MRMPTAIERLRDGALAAALLALLLTGCEARVSVDLAASGHGSTDEVNLAIDGVDLLDEDGSNHELDRDGDDDTVDVLDYIDGDSVRLVDEASLAQGRYTGLRLRFADGGSTLVTASGASYPIDVIGNANFADIDIELGEDDSAEQQVILETRFSLYPSTTVNGHYSLQPVMRVVDTQRSGSITGSVDAELMRSSNCRQGRALGEGAAVYAFSGANVSPRDYLQDTGGSPVASADIVVNDDAASFSYQFAALKAGRYTLALTCNADGDNPTVSDAISFLATASVQLSEQDSESVTLSQ